MDKFFHSVTLDESKCVGCTNCIKRCPTEAIRVRDKKAVIQTERCIDCAECIRVCPHHAKRANSDALSILDSFEYKIAIPAPALFGQFNNLDDVDIVLNGLKGLGFDYIYEVSRGAEFVSDITRLLLKEGKIIKPLISSACPVITRLIRLKFPELCNHVLPVEAPFEVASVMAKREAHQKTGIPIEKMAAIFITPCPAKVTDVKSPLNKEKSFANAAISISSIYPKLLESMNKLEKIEPIAKSGIIGVGWAASAGEASALLMDKYLAADGIENVIRVLEQIEDQRIGDLDFIELNACSGGCVGGVFCVENGYIAQARIKRLRKYLTVSENHLEGDIPKEFMWKNKLKFEPVLKLSNDIEKAMVMMEKIEKIRNEFPGMDCGSCGAPSCRALAEDIVLGKARKTDCIYIFKEQVKSVADKLIGI